MRMRWASRWLGIAVLVGLGWGLGLGRARLQRVQASAGAGERTWYVRPDGGDRKQCTGLADAAYRGHGSGQACAFKDPQMLYSNGEYGNKKWIVAGGDTMLLRGGPYRIGFRGPDSKDFNPVCPGDPFTCFMPGIPSGTKEHPTRLLGEHYASCDKKTQLFGGYAVGDVVNLSDSHDVDVECLELTDHGSCSRQSGLSAADTCSTSYPLSDFGGAGIVTNVGTADVRMKNLDIHGFMSRGIIGPVGGAIDVEDVRIAYNGGAGWDFDDGRGTKSAPGAFVHAKGLVVEWNGCNEEYPIKSATPAHNCFDQDHQGYGDGVGTPDTPLSFTCDHCVFRYNTQDGLDLLHVSGSEIEVTNSISRGNMGQQWKMGTMQRVVFRNNVTVHNCRRLSVPFPGAPEGYNAHLDLFCRAGGDGIVFSVMDGGSYVFQNNSYVGYGATTYDFACDVHSHCTTPNVVFANNLHIGYKDTANGEYPAVFYPQNLPKNPFAARGHDVYFRMRSCPAGTDERCVDPKVVNMPPWTGEATLDHVDLHLTAASPARSAGVVVSGMTTDFDGTARPSGAAPDVGAFQFHP